MYKHCIALKYMNKYFHSLALKSRSAALNIKAFETTETQQKNCARLQAHLSFLQWQKTPGKDQGLFRYTADTLLLNLHFYEVLKAENDRAIVDQVSSAAHGKRRCTEHGETGNCPWFMTKRQNWILSKISQVICFLALISKKIVVFVHWL